MIWAGIVRVMVMLHVTWFVNSASHVWGYRNFETTDDSRNLWWVAIITFGEGWHNNHHAQHRSAAHGMRWWEFDLTYLIIRMMKSVGLAWDIVLPDTTTMVNPPADAQRPARGNVNQSIFQPEAN
jgi:stearoyl-CoA desaturase (delta-9 desaturase)